MAGASFTRLSRCLSASTLPAAAKSVAGPVAKPRIEAAFVLDTTGSMSGLIEGAKRKIWSLANRMTDAEAETVVGHSGVEPETSALSARRSNQLS